MNDQNKIIITELNGKQFLFLLNQSRLFSVYPFSSKQESLLGQIYIGKIQTISVNLQAAFVEVQKGVLGFLPLNDCKKQYPSPKAGDEILVQVSKDAIKTKLPMLTTKVSLTGTYCVLSLNSRSPMLHLSSKLSRKDADRIRQYLQKEEIGENPSYDTVIRTKAGELSDFQPIVDEYKALSKELSLIVAKSHTRTCFSCLKKEGFPAWMMELKSIPQSDYEEIITDLEEIYHQLAEFCTGSDSVYPVSKPIRLYQDENYPLRILYGVSSKLEYALNRRIWLKSGAYLIIEPTEAMTVIDVNTGKYEAKKENKEAVFAVNKEAAEEVALQMRLRNLSGIILIDFINMNSKEYEKELLQFMRSLTIHDRIQTNVIDITPLGLMEITRKKIRKSLKEELRE